jgi:hypothetical protein
MSDFADMAKDPKHHRRFEKLLYLPPSVATPIWWRSGFRGESIPTAALPGALRL